MLHRGVIGALIAVWLAAGLSAPSAAAEQADVRQMMELSGLTTIYGDLGDFMREEILAAPESLAPMPSEAIDAFADATAEAMQGARFLADLEAEFAASLTPEDVGAMIDFARSPLGQRVYAAEAAIATPEHRVELREHEDALRASLEADPDRLAIARSVDEDLHGSEVGAALVRTLSRAVAIGVLSGRSSGGAVPREALAVLDQQIDASYPQILEDMRRNFLASFALIYRDVPLDDLRAYQDFLKSPAARTTYRAFALAVRKLYDVRGREIGERFAAFLAERRI